MSSKKKPESSDSSSESEVEYEVEDIITERFHRGQTEYRIRWLGYPPDADTWEPEAALEGCPEIFQAYKDRTKREQEKRYKKSKKSGKSKKRKASSSPSPGSSRVTNEIAMDDVFESAPKTPPGNNTEEETDSTEVIPKSSKKSKNKEKSVTPLVRNDDPSSSKSKTYQIDPITSSSSSSHNKKKKQKSSKKTSHHQRDTTLDEEDKSPVPTKSSSDESSRQKKDKTHRDLSTSTVKQTSSEKEKTPNVTPTKKTVSSSTSNNTTTNDSAAAAATEDVSSEKDKTSNEAIPANRIPAHVVEQPFEPNALSETSEVTPVLPAPFEKEKSKDKTGSSPQKEKVVAACPPVQSQNITTETSSVPVNPTPITSTPVLSFSTLQTNPVAPSVSRPTILEGTPQQTSAPQLVKISEVLAMNPPNIKDEVSELSGQFTSTNITLPSGDKSAKRSLGNLQEPGSSRQQSLPSRSSSSASSVIVATDGPGSSRQLINAEPTRITPIVFEDPTRPQQSHTVITMPTFDFGRAAQDRPFSSLEQPFFGFSTPAFNRHKCFGNDPTVFQFANDIQVHNVNCQKSAYVLAKIWKLRCPECTAKNPINDATVEFAYCLFTKNSQTYFMIKLKNHVNELYCIDANQYKISCPMGYANFTALTREYFESLGDLEMQIEEQNARVYHSMRSGPLIVYLNGGSITDPEIFQTQSVVQTVREITQLFYLQLTLAIGNYMCKQVDATVLHSFVMNYYEKRDEMFALVSKIGVEHNYEAMYANLIPKPNLQI